MDRHAGELHRLAMTRVFCHCEELATKQSMQRPVAATPSVGRWGGNRLGRATCCYAIQDRSPRRQTAPARVFLSLRGACDEAIHATTCSSDIVCWPIDNAP